MSLRDEDLRRLKELRGILGRMRRGPRALSAAEAAALPRLYRHACSVLARLEARNERPAQLAEVRRLVGEAHGILHRPPPPRAPLVAAGDALSFLASDAPRAIRSEWRLFALSFALVYGLAIASYLAVRSDLDLAPSLLNAQVVESEIRQLQETAEGEPFRGNFTFGLPQAPQTAGWIMVHNMGVGVLFFAAALVPPIYLVLLATNGLMLGTYTGVAAHWDQAGAISSILWCHGVIEIQSIVLAGTAGLVLVRAWIRPGAWTRTHALRRESRVAWRLLAPVFPLLACAGLIEAFVSPHAPLAVRLATAVGTGLVLVAWVALGGRRSPRPGQPSTIGE